MYMICICIYAKKCSFGVYHYHSLSLYTILYYKASYNCHRPVVENLYYIKPMFLPFSHVAVSTVMGVLYPKII